MGVSIRPRVVAGEEKLAKRRSIEDIARRVYNWIKLSKVVPVAGVRVESVELRKGYGFLKGYNVGYIDSEGARFRVRFEPDGFRECIHVSVDKGIVAIYNDEPHGMNTAIVVYNE